ncbi:MAG: hypothetical protein ACXVZX_09610 [Terriglobales bacterium]
MNRLIIAFLLLTSICFGQEPKPTPTFISPSARLAAAKTAYVKNVGESEVPYNVIEGGLEGWPHFMLVGSPDKADVVIEIATVEDETGVNVSSDSGGKKSRVTHDLNVTLIKLTVYDAKTHLPLWTASERPKGAFKDKNREDNLVQASEKLLAKFRDRMEPAPTTTEPAK